READAVADAVMRSIGERAGADPEPVDVDGVELRPRDRVSRMVSRAAPLGLEGGPVDRETERDIGEQRRSGTPLPAKLRGSMEGALGTELGGVRVHSGPKSDALNAAMQSRAFTVGSDIFFARHQYRPQTSSGQHLLAHELAHVVQQTGPGTVQPVRRAVGFEFEDGSWTVLKLQTGYNWLRDPTSYRLGHWLGGGKIAAPGSEKTDEERNEEEYTGENIFAQPAAGHINNLVGQFNLQSGPKKGALHEGLGYRIEPDGPYTQGGYSNVMDLEIVTEPFPETEQGEQRLVAALADLQKMFAKYNSGASGDWLAQKDSLSYGRFVGPSVHGFSTSGIYLYGGKPGGEFKPQVTGGVSLSDLPHVMETLGTTGAVDDRDEEKDAVRQLVYRENDPVALTQGSVTQVLGTAPGRARTVVGKLVTAGVLTDESEGLDQLTGFLSLAIVYMSVLSRTIREGIKNELPLMSRYSFATLWAQVPAATRSLIADSSDILFEALSPEVAASVRLHVAKYDNKKVTAKRANGMGDPMLYLDPRLAPGFSGLLGSMTRRDWLWYIVNDGPDLLDPKSLIPLVRASEHAAVADKYDKSMAIFFRGHGNTKNVKKVEGEPEGGLALLENRNIQGPLTFPESVDLARKYFSWMRLVKQGDLSSV
ncbi:MAG: DUF4157 domain-containing protein, partial [Acidimicrobiales bacterium]